MRLGGRGSRAARQSAHAALCLPPLVAIQAIGEASSNNWKSGTAGDDGSFIQEMVAEGGGRFVKG